MFGVFHDAGYKGLYGGLGVDAIKIRKGIAPKENLMDRMDTTELIANQFRMSQTREKLKRGESTKSQTTNPQSTNLRENETRRCLKLIRRMLTGFRLHLDDELRAKKVTTAQLRFLHEVKERPGSSGAQMARACFVTPQSAQTMMVRAVERGWVRRGKNAENGRVVTAELTPAGERLLRYADGVLSRMEAEVWSGVGLPELRTMNAVLERGLRNLDG